MKYILVLFVSLILASCQTTEESLYSLISPEKSGVNFANTIVENEQYNVFDYHNLYNGGGVGIGDVNNDGLPDLYFTGNMVDDKLYLNKGNFEFEDVTAKAGIKLGGWSTGVCMVDINNDGLLDIYVSKSGNEPGERRANQLYINQGNATFIEEAAAFGIADTSYTNQAAFFDYDKDGDLDLYLLNTSNLVRNANLLRKPINDGTGYATDKLYRNDGQKFSDVTVSAGILTNGHGLGLSIGDVNNDGWEDILASSDFLPNDALYINNQDGTFTDRGKEYFSYHSRFSMGNDIADINNDGWADVVMTDMLPEANEQQKKMLLTSYQVFEAEKELGYYPEFTRNMLHINQGKTPDGSVLFSEIGQMSGINATDWSWAPLIADFDNDGNRDLFISNGYYRDVTDSDFMAYNMTFAKQAQTQAEIREYMVSNSLKLPSVKRKNHFFKNYGGVDLQEITNDWDESSPSFSNGAAYGDLDNDGDLDMVVSNINQAAFVLKNNTENNFLQLELKGSKNNVNGLGADIKITTNGTTQYWHQSVVRGYLSSVDKKITLGVGDAKEVESVVIRWPDGKQQRLTNLSANKLVTLNYAYATNANYFTETKPPKPTWFTDVSADVNLNYTHVEERYIDYNAENLLLHKLSQQGPKLTKGDVNKDGLEDFVIGGSYGHFDKLFLQNVNGTFVEKTVSSSASVKNRETVGIELFDADNDGDLDLYLVSGSNEFVDGSANYQDELLLSDGLGNFRAGNNLPKITSSGSCVAVADFDKDGDLDIFRGGRLIPLAFPQPGRSMLLVNENGKFGAQTPDFLQNIGMVNDAKWVDVDNDTWVDLVIVGEFMPVTIIYNKAGKLQTPVIIPNTEGLWNCLKTGDLDNDGDVDFIAGNIGLNTRYKFSENEPLRVYGLDYDNNGRFDAIPSYYLNGVEYPISTRDDLLRQIPTLRNKFPNYASYATAKFEGVLSKAEQKNALIAEAKLMESCYFINDGSGKFGVIKLPRIAQWAPVQDVLLTDLNNDSRTDIVIVGNAFDTEPATSGFHGASVGLILLNSAANKFTAHTYSETGFIANGDNKSIIAVQTSKGKQRLIISQNSDKLLFYEKNN